MIRDTIFSPSFGNRPSYLVGREEILDTLMDSLASRPGSKGRATVILGQRGSGKTVLLWELADRATSAGYVVATPTVASEGMTERIVEKIQDAGERHLPSSDVRVSGGSVGALGFSVGLQFTKAVQETKSFGYKLVRLARELTRQHRGMLVLVDELQANSPEVKQLVIAYQELVGEGLDVALVMAGLPGAVSATLNDKVLTFLNRAQKIELAPLRIADIDAYYQQAFAALGLAISDEERLRASKATCGSPYLLQLIGHAIVVRAGDTGMVTHHDLQLAIEQSAREFGNDVCRTTLAALSDQDVAFLRAMAADAVSNETAEGAGPSRMADVARRMGVTADYAQKYRRRLIDSGVIEAPGRGKVAFCVPYLAEHLRSNE